MAGHRGAHVQGMMGRVAGEVARGTVDHGGHGHRVNEASGIGRARRWPSRRPSRAGPASTHQGNLSFFCFLQGCYQYTGSPTSGSARARAVHQDSRIKPQTPAIVGDRPECADGAGVSILAERRPRGGLRCHTSLRLQHPVKHKHTVRLRSDKRRAGSDGTPT